MGEGKNCELLFSSFRLSFFLSRRASFLSSFLLSGPDFSCGLVEGDEGEEDEKVLEDATFFVEIRAPDRRGGGERGEQERKREGTAREGTEE